MQLSTLMANVNEDARPIPLGHGLTIMVRPSGTREFDDCIRELTLRTKTGAARGPVMSRKEMDEIQLEATARHILVGWSGLTDEKGAEVPYSPEMSLKLLSTNYRFYKTVTMHGMQLASEAAQFEAEAQGN